jgi:hypothetical protein
MHKFVLLGCCYCRLVTKQPNKTLQINNANVEGTIVWRGVEVGGLEGQWYHRSLWPAIVIETLCPMCATFRLHQMGHRF